MQFGVFYDKIVTFADNNETEYKNMSQNTFSMAGGVARNPLVRLAKPVTATIGADEHIAIVGPVSYTHLTLPTT